MITISETFTRKLNYPLSMIGNPEEILFFDIETTGLSAYNSCCYLIGAVYFRNNEWHLKQWFSPSLSSEKEMLEAFFRFTEDFSILAHFNGDTFDLRYLEATASQYNMSTPFSELYSFDILKKIRRYKRLYNLPNYKQKTIESFLNLNREDKYSGGELISVYEDYVHDQDPVKKELLLLHNADDLRGMPDILPALSYVDALQSKFHVDEFLRNRAGTKMFITVSFDFDFPVPLDYNFSDEISLHFEGNQIKLKVAMQYDTMKFFYKDVQNYWYLPKEDYAIHKKLANFVDKTHKQKATPENCYQRMTGFFVPYVKGSGLPVFTDSYKSNLKLHNMEPNEEFVQKYVSTILLHV